MLCNKGKGFVYSIDFPMVKAVNIYHIYSLVLNKMRKISRLTSYQEQAKEGSKLQISVGEYDLYYLI